MLIEWEGVEERVWMVVVVFVKRRCNSVDRVVEEGEGGMVVVVVVVDATEEKI